MSALGSYRRALSRWALAKSTDAETYFFGNAELSRNLYIQSLYKKQLLSFEERLMSFDALPINYFFLHKIDDTEQLYLKVTKSTARSCSTNKIYIMRDVNKQNVLKMLYFKQYIQYNDQKYTLEVNI